MATINGTALANILNGTASNDQINGLEGNDTLNGGAGNDTLNGGAGNDRLNGESGVDRMIGGGGNDIYFVNAAGDVVVELVNQGVDTVNASVSYTLGAHVDNLVLTGTGNLNGTGNLLNNVITGTSGANTLTGASGNDTLNGGLGNDVLVGDTLTGGPAGDALTPTAAAYLNSAGNSLVRTLGNVTNNPDPARAVATGFGENALVTNDDGSTASIDITSVFGGAGIDFFGQQFTSLYVNNNGNITFAAPQSTYTPTAINGGVNNPIIAPFWADVDTRGLPGVVTPGGTSGGSNRVYYDLDAVNGVFTATWDDVGYFASHSDRLNAFQLQLVDRGSGDFDIIFRYEAVNWTTGDASDGIGGLGGVITRAGYSAGSGSTNYFELAQSGNQNAILALDTTLGNSGRTGVYIFNVRNGAVQAIGDDLLNGGAGADTMRGGLGNDTYVRDSASDVIVENPNSGIDTVQSSLAYTLPVNVERLTLTGTSHVNATGNGAANLLIGNNGNNVLNGTGGADTLNGLGGNDTLIWDAADTKVDGGAGTDTLWVSGANQTLNLLTVANTKIVNVEVFNITGTGNNRVELSLQDVLDLSTTTNTLRVDGNAGDTVDRNTGWTQGANQVIGANSYRSYTQGAATLLVDTDITSVT